MASFLGLLLANCALVSRFYRQPLADCANYGARNARVALEWFMHFQIIIIIPKKRSRQWATKLLGQQLQCEKRKSKRHLVLHERNRLNLLCAAFHALHTFNQPAQFLALSPLQKRSALFCARVQSFLRYAILNFNFPTKLFGPVFL